MFVFHNSFYQIPCRTACCFTYLTIFISSYKKHNYVFVSPLWQKIELRSWKYCQCRWFQGHFLWLQLKLDKCSFVICYGLSSLLYYSIAWYFWSIPITTEKCRTRCLRFGSFSLCLPLEVRLVLFYLICLLCNMYMCFFSTWNNTKVGYKFSKHFFLHAVAGIAYTRGFRRAPPNCGEQVKILWFPQKQIITFPLAIW